MNGTKVISAKTHRHLRHTSSTVGLPAWFALCVLMMGLLGRTSLPAASVAKWAVHEEVLTSSKDYANPLQEAELRVTFTSPTGASFRTYGFWDGDKTWRIRFAPGQTGTWTWKTICSDISNQGLHGREGKLQVLDAAGDTRFHHHGPVIVSRDGRYFAHQDGTPYFLLSDTAWNGALKSTSDDWSFYIKERSKQKFNAVQWVATQWRAAPDGDLLGRKAFDGKESIRVHPEFFQRLDQKVQSLNEAGLLSIPVMLWAIGGGSNPDINPGHALPESQAILLGKYMVARWDAYQSFWILPGDSDYRGDKADRWQRIGRGIFADIEHDPVTLHPGGMQSYFWEFHDESWVDFISYQSGHGDDAKTLQWIQEGPMTQSWWVLPHKPFVNLEPAYENHIAYQSKKAHDDVSVRNAIYWSLLTCPTAGTSYGGHGVWGWDDGTKPPTDHQGSGIPLPWKEALHMPAAQQMAHLADLFNSIDFQRLRPTPGIVVNQPGQSDPAQYVAAAKTDQKDLALAYIPHVRTVEIKLDALPPSPNITWFNPRTGERSPAVAVVTSSTCQFPTPAEGDWVLLMQTETKEASNDAP